MSSRQVLPSQPYFGIFVAVAANLLPLNDAGAQDFADTQTAVNRVLFAAQDIATERRAAEARRIEALDRRAEQQDRLLREQAIAVQRLGGELQALRDEKQVTELAAAFDAMIAAQRWSAARSLLADTIAVDLEGRSETPVTAISADAVIAGLAQSSVGISIGPRTNQQVAINADHAVLTSDGMIRSFSARPKASADRFGTYEYRFVKVTSDWKIDSLIFHLN